MCQEFLGTELRAGNKTKSLPSQIHNSGARQQTKSDTVCCQVETNARSRISKAGAAGGRGQYLHGGLNKGKEKAGEQQARSVSDAGTSKNQGVKARTLQNYTSQLLRRNLHWCNSPVENTDKDLQEEAFDRRFLLRIRLSGLGQPNESDLD